MKGSGLEQPASPSGLEAVSGISDTLAPGALGKVICASVTGALRDLPYRVADILPRLLTVPINARIYTERGGTGNEYHTLKYRIRDLATDELRLVSHYLGHLDAEQVKWVKAVLEERAVRHAESGPACLPIDFEHIRQLMVLRDQAHACARRIARRAGYSWRGFRLLKQISTMR